MLLLTVLLGCGTAPSVRDSRDGCLSDENAESCYRVGIDALAGVEVPNEFGKPVPLTPVDAALFLGEACMKDFKDSCSLLPGLIGKKNVSVGEVLGGLLIACKDRRVRSACAALSAIHQQHPDALSPQMVETATKGLEAE